MIYPLLQCGKRETEYGQLQKLLSLIHGLLATTFLRYPPEEKKNPSHGRDENNWNLVTLFMIWKTQFNYMQNNEVEMGNNISYKKEPLNPDGFTTIIRRI